MDDINICLATGAFVARIIAASNIRQDGYCANDMGCLDAPQFMPAGNSLNNSGHVAFGNVDREPETKNMLGEKK